MLYYLYRTTCLRTGKIYYGVHKTNRLKDGYLGSGSLLLRDIRQYGKGSFRKDIVLFFENETDMFRFEKDIVNQSFLERTDVYNCRLGGEGAFNYNDYANMSKIARARIKGKGHDHTGRILVHNVELGLTRKLKKQEAEEHLAKGWIRGMKAPKPRKHGTWSKHKELVLRMEDFKLPLALTSELSISLGYTRLYDLKIGLLKAIKDNSFQLEVVRLPGPGSFTKYQLCSKEV